MTYLLARQTRSLDKKKWVWTHSINSVSDSIGGIHKP
jgi:hypothetical protein